MKLGLCALAVIFSNFCLIGYSQAIVKYKTLPVVIKGHFADLNQNDSLEVQATLWPYTLPSGDHRKSEVVKSKPFVFSFLPIDAPATLTLDVIKRENGKSTGMPIIIAIGILVEPGDTIEIIKNNWVFTTSTRSRKVELVRKIYSSISQMKQKRWKGFNECRPTKSDYEFLDSLTWFGLDKLDSIKSMISQTYYYVTRINMLSANQDQKLMCELNLLGKEYLKMRVNYKPEPNFPDITSVRASLADYHDRPKIELEKLFLKYPQYFPYSYYKNFVLDQYKKDSCLLSNSPFDISKYYLYLKNKFRGTLREILIAYTIFSNSLSMPNKGTTIQDAMKYIKNQDIRSYLNKLYAGVDGGIAYKFSLPDLKGNIISLDSLKNKIVVLDFWFNGCTGCVIQHPKFEKVVDYYLKNPDIVFISINVNKFISDWKKGVASGMYTMDGKTNLINISSANNHLEFSNMPIVANYGLTGCPAMFVINGKGIIESSGYITDNGDKIISQINKLINRGNK